MHKHSSPEVITLGNVLVEVMRLERDIGLGQTGELFAGPYPSGDPAIYADTVARLGGSAGFIGVVGDDDFGRSIIERFERDGVDFSRGIVSQSHTTGVAFVSYFSDGSRRFIFHWRDSASGQLGPDQIDAAYIQSAKWVHITGSTLGVNESCRAAVMRVLELLDPATIVSFDPNIRPEVLTVEQIRELCQPVLERANLFLPSASEAMLFTGAASDEAGCRLLAAQGKRVVLKLGEQGCWIFEGQHNERVAGFAVEEIDPTGAGDSFSAALTVALLEGHDLASAARFANAVGALAVTKRGPMEGAPTREEVAALLT